MRHGRVIAFRDANKQEQAFADGSDSLTLDRRAMYSLGAIYILLNVLVMSVDLSGGTG